MRAGALALALALVLAACKDGGRGAAPGARPHDAAVAARPDAGSMPARSQTPSLDGVWRQESFVSDGKPVLTTWDHWVFAGTTARLVDLDQVHYDDDDREEGTLEVDLEARPPSLQVQLFRVPATGSKFLTWADRGRFQLDGDRLVIRWERGVETLVREPDAALAARLAAPPVRVARPRRTEPGLGELRWDDNLDWWDARIDLDGHGPAKVSFYGAAAPAEPFFVAARRTVAALRGGALARARGFAADQLLALYNDTWRDDRARLDAAGFVANLWIEGVTVHEDGAVDIYFYDSDMFLGHAVLVHLDAGLRPTAASIAG